MEALADELCTAVATASRYLYYLPSVLLALLVRSMYYQIIQLSCCNVKYDEMVDPLF